MSTAGLSVPALAQSAPGAPASPPPAPAPTAPAASGPALTTVVPIANGSNAPSSDVQPNWGNIRTFWGDSSPFWGNIRTFWGDTGPYSADLTAFWGNIRTFNDGSNANSILPQWGNIRTFAGDIGASWGNIRTFWGGLDASSASTTDYQQLATQIGGMVSLSETTFGATVQAKTGQSFTAAFTNPMLAKYGIDLNNPQSLAAVDANTREHFFLDWWDNLMQYSGADHVDHWMKEVNWSPVLTQTLGAGRQTTIGLLDFTVTGAEAANVVKAAGVSTVANGHGAAVASVLVAPMDGIGAMGFAPSAKVISYNPFDATQTAGWADIKNGVKMLTQNGASVVNASLGVPGWTLAPDWNTVFTDPTVALAAKNAIVVTAAGNDGSTQTQNIQWATFTNPTFIVVGSVDPNGNISAFSNRPGTACLTEWGYCRPGNELMNHFIVAPGELILVDDGNGGVTRYSGTSFAAPMVSGTIALIHDRWPWLTNYPGDVFNVIMKSAKDLGAPGPDPVYGVGELDVTAALSPLDWTKLQYKQVVNGKTQDTTLKALQGTSSKDRSNWQVNNVYITAFEQTGSSYRDFEIPMSSKLSNQTVSIQGVAQQFMGYLTSRFTSILGTPTKLADGTPVAAGFTDLRPATADFVGAGGIVTSLSMRPRVNQMGFARTGAPIESAIHMADADERFGFDMGNGGSAGVIGSQAGFGMASDYDVENGGANPFLGFASGGSFAKVSVRLAPGVHLSSAVTERSLKYDTAVMRLDQKAGFSSDPYHATAATMAMNVDATPRLSTSIAYTVLHEDGTVLGMGSGDRSDLPNGSTTDAATIGASYALTGTLSLSGSATMGRTRSGDAASGGLAVGRSGLVSTAFQMAATKQRVFDGNDRLRFSVAQPMHVERGTLDYSAVAVIDRETGELGVVTQHGGVTGSDRRVVSEMIYGRSLMGGASEVSLFGRANIGGDRTDYAPLTVGTSFRLAL